MARWRRVDAGTTRGQCRACRQEADLTLRESSLRRGWRDLLDPHFDDRVDRTVTCSACRSTYPVRRDDRRAG